MLLHYTRGVAKNPRQRSILLSKLCKLIRHVLHYLLDSAISGEAQSTASSPANERKTVFPFHFCANFVRVIRRFNSCKHFSPCMLKTAGEVERRQKTWTHPQGLESEDTLVRIDLF